MRIEKYKEILHQFRKNSCKEKLLNSVEKDFRKGRWKENEFDEASYGDYEKESSTKEMFNGKRKFMKIRRMPELNRRCASSKKLNPEAVDSRILYKKKFKLLQRNRKSASIFRRLAPISSEKALGILNFADRHCASGILKIPSYKTRKVSYKPHLQPISPPISPCKSITPLKKPKYKAPDFLFSFNLENGVMQSVLFY